MKRIKNLLFKIITIILVMVQTTSVAYFCTDYHDSIPDNFESLPDNENPPPELSEDSPQYKLFVKEKKGI